MELQNKKEFVTVMRGYKFITGEVYVKYWVVRQSHHKADAAVKV